jgi:ASC-1-like (ASCH) protein
MRTPETESPRTIYVKRQFFEMIRAGTKTLELRVGFPTFREINVGDSITFSSGGGETVDVEIIGIRPYRSLEEVIQSEDASKIAPGMAPDVLLKEAKRFILAVDVAKRGLLVFEFRKI